MKKVLVVLIAVVFVMGMVFLSGGAAYAADKKGGASAAQACNKRCDDEYNKCKQSASRSNDPRKMENCTTMRGTCHSKCGG